MRCEPGGKGPATVPETGALQARLLADFRSSVQSGPCLEGFGRCHRDMRGRTVVVGGAASFPIGRRSASAEAAKCALASGCAEARAMIDALLTCGEVDNPCSRAVASTGSVLQRGPSPWPSMQRSSAFLQESSNRAGVATLRSRGGTGPWHPAWKLEITTRRSEEHTSELQSRLHLV